MNNRYLQDRAMRRGGRRDRAIDSRNPYGSRGGYVTSSRRGRDRAMDYGDYNQQYGGRNDYRYEPPYNPMMYEMYGTGSIQPSYDYNQSYMNNDYARGRNRDYGYDYASQEMNKEYEEKLHHWINKMKSKDRFNIPKEEIIKNAKNIGINFNEYNEDEFYAIYLAMVTDYKSLNADYITFIKLAKDWLEDDDIAVNPSEKICIYLFEIVMGEM